MAYRLEPGEPLARGIRRVVGQQIDRTIDALLDPELSPHDKVLQVRKRFKRVRAALRLVRDELGETYAAENAWYRDAARELAPVRDAQARLETIDRLAAQSDDAALRETLRLVRQRVAVYRDDVARDMRLHAVLTDLIGRLNEARERLDEWPLPSDDAFARMRPSVKRVYRRGRRALITLRKKGATDPRLHEWRKRAKYLRHGLRLLQWAWPETLIAWRDELHEVTGSLGVDRDLGKLAAFLDAPPEPFLWGDIAPAEARAAIGEAAVRQQEALRREADQVGRRLYAQKRGDYVDQLGAWWEIAREENGT